MKAKKLILIFTVFGVVGFGVGKTVKTFKKNHDLTEQIQTVLEDHCNCEDIARTTYSHGIQYAKDDGFTSSKVKYQLTNCDYANFDAEVVRIDELLKAKVDRFETIDLMTLDFISESGHRTITIANGKIR
ncbi:hypothetical protein [Gelidibacter pelagius]|uniref:Uncharacterized protein n=1 Tax=Gelidibacter pelagius TaxID=2819985 RepID=A0ABS3SLT8_9FLAO|nr:hypothetical protein [Gelidibacter pelagius]MBO3096659.1 hypothetical protein [Gelidibacter pelagius]